MSASFNCIRHSLVKIQINKIRVTYILRTEKWSFCRRRHHCRFHILLLIHASNLTLIKRVNRRRRKRFVFTHIPEDLLTPTKRLRNHPMTSRRRKGFAFVVHVFAYVSRVITPTSRGRRRNAVVDDGTGRRCT